MVRSLRCVALFSPILSSHLPHVTKHSLHTLASQEAKVVKDLLQQMLPAIGDDESVIQDADLRERVQTAIACTLHFSAFEHRA